ncbi:MAG: twin-arginine translocase TatA/TatE family subunit [Parcubacteria group bacterium]
MLGLGTSEVIIVAGILVLLFGSRKVPELAHGIGEAIRYIRNVFSEAEEINKIDKVN